MKMNPLRLLGLLGLVGLAGLFTGNYGFFGFFGFFAFLGLAREGDDEMLRRNVGRASFNAFVVSLVGFPVGVIAASFIGAVEDTLLFVVIYFAALFAAQYLTFVFSFNHYEKAGDLG